MNIFKSFVSQKGKFHPPILVFLLLIGVLFFNISMVESQPTDTFNLGNQQQNQKFSPPVAIVIVLLVAALFFMAFFCIYIRECTSITNSTSTTNNNVQNAIALARRANRNGIARGLEASVVETFPMFSYTEIKGHKIGKGALECAVCLNEFGDDETLRLIPKCDHVFHPECIDAWLQHHVTCPVCRTNLTPQPGDEPYHLPESNQENPENNNAAGRSDDVAVDVDLQEEQVEDKPEVNRIWSLKYLIRPPRTESVKRGGRNMIGLGKFRSHSTGHSLVQPGENVDRFTLILPQEIRKEMMNRALLNRTKSVAAVLPRERSSIRRWYSSRFEQPDRVAESDRWAFSKTASFFSRAKSGKPTKVVAENGEASTFSMVKLPSLKCLEPKSIDEMSLRHVEPVQPPV